MPEDVSAFADPLEVFLAIDLELSISPEYYYSYFTEDTSFACPYGGSFTFGPGGSGETYNFSECAFTRGFAITGDGGFDYDASTVTFEAEVSGDKSGSLTFTYDYRSGKAHVTGDYGGETIDLSR
jgi:hypothetical protein